MYYPCIYLLCILIIFIYVTTNIDFFCYRRGVWSMWGAFPAIFNMLVTNFCCHDISSHIPWDESIYSMYIVTLNVVFVVRVSRHFQHAGNKLLSSRYVTPHTLKQVYILHVCILTQIVCVVRVYRHVCYQNKLVSCITSSILVNIWCQVIFDMRHRDSKSGIFICKYKQIVYVCVSIYLYIRVDINTILLYHRNNCQRCLQIVPFRKSRNLVALCSAWIWLNQAKNLKGTPTHV